MGHRSGRFPVMIGQLRFHPIPMPTELQDIIDTLIGSWAQAWNGHDADALAALVWPDVEFITVAGLWLRGAPAFAAHHRSLHDGPMRGTRWTNHGHDMRRLHYDLALVYLEWTIAGEREPDGAARPDRPGVFTWLLMRDGAAWRIAAAHNTNLRADVRHRLVSAAGAAEPGGRP